MRKIDKMTNIALIFMLIGVVWAEAGYALRPSLSFSETAKELELIRGLSSGNRKEIDKKLKELDEIYDAEKVTSIVNSVFENRGLYLERSKDYNGIKIMRKKDETIVGLRDFNIVYGKKHHLNFKFASIDKKYQRKRLFLLLYRWMAAHPYFRSRFSGWETKALGVSYLSARAWWRSGFDDIKVICVQTGDTIHNIEDIKKGKTYDITARFPTLASGEMVVEEVDINDVALIKAALSLDPHYSQNVLLIDAMTRWIQEGTYGELFIARDKRSSEILGFLRYERRWRGGA